MTLSGDALTSRYQLLAPLGAGAMGAVYRAHDRLSGQDVALKHVTLELASQDADLNELRLALAHEFRLLAGLRHPHIISVLDYGFDRERQPFFTMDLITSAQPILKAGAGLPLAANVHLLLQALEALAYLHRRGVLHHDLKPENVLVSAGRVRLLDFGLAVLAHQQRDDDAFGTLLYLAPEVLEGDPYTETADLYSLGVIAYELFAGRHPFPTDSVHAFLHHTRAEPPDLTPLADQPALAAVLGQLLAKAPTERPSASASIAALRQAIGLPSAAVNAAIRESYLQAATFVGRETELALLTAAIEQVHQGQGSAWLIGGESGVGKSRLLEELRTQALVGGCTVLRGQAVEGGGLRYQLWCEPLRRLCLEADLTPLDASIFKELVPDIGDLIGQAVPDAPTLPGPAHLERLQIAISAQLRRQTQPTLLLLEDLQWCDESLSLLKLLVRGADTARLCIVGTYRSDERPSLPAELPDARQLTLARLPAPAIAALTSSILGSGGTAPQLVDLLQHETEGNVFFLVEMVRALAEEAGNLEQIARMSLPRALLTGGVQQVLRRRLARMPTWGQPLLTLAAVSGRQIDRTLLARLAPDIDQEGWLNAGAAAAILEVSDEQWRFAHDKLRETLLADLTDSTQPQLHRRVAEALEALYGDQAAYAQPLYDHWRAAQEPARALPYAAVVADALMYAAPAHRVLSFVEAALSDATTVEDDNSAARLWRVAGLVHQLLGNVDQVLEALHTSLRYGQRLAHKSSQVETLTALAWVYYSRSQLDQALHYGTQAIELGADIDDAVVVSRAFNLVGIVHIRLNQYQQARALLEQALAHAHAANAADRIAATTNNLGLVAERTGEIELAQMYYQRCLAICQASGNRNVAFSATNNLGVIANDRFDDAQALHYLELALTLAREMNNHEQIAITLVNLSTYYNGQLATERAQSLIEEGLVVARQAGDLRNEIYFLNNLAMSCVESGAFQAAQQAAEAALAIAEANNSLDQLPVLQQTLGNIARNQGHWAQSAAAYATGLSQTQGALMVEAGLLQDRAIACWLQRDYTAAERDFATAADLLQKLAAPFKQAATQAFRALNAADQGRLDHAQQLLDTADALLAGQPAPRIRAQLALAQTHLHICAGAAEQGAALLATLEGGPRIARLLREHVLAPLRQRLAGERGQGLPTAWPAQYTPRSPDPTRAAACSKDSRDEQTRSDA